MKSHCDLSKSAVLYWAAVTALLGYEACEPQLAKADISVVQKRTFT